MEYSGNTNIVTSILYIYSFGNSKDDCEEPLCLRTNGLWGKPADCDLFLPSWKMSGHFPSVSMIPLINMVNIGRGLTDPNLGCLLMEKLKPRCDVIYLKLCHWFIWSESQHLSSIPFFPPLHHAETSLKKPVSHDWKVWN